jgi:hypothetical protein
MGLALCRYSWALLVPGLLCAADDASNRNCPISGRDVDPEFTLFHEGARVGFCCGNCLDDFRSSKENRLSKQEAKDGWKLLFNGKNLEGFSKPTREGKWQAKKGVLVGTGGAGVLGTVASFEDFSFRADVRVHDTGERRGNSGIFIRNSGLTALRGKWPDGPEIQVDHADPNYWTGAIWKRAKAKKVTTKDKEWFQIKFEARGPDIRVWVDGDLVTEHKSEGPVRGGPIALQVHHPTDVVEFKNVKLLVHEKS